MVTVLKMRSWGQGRVSRTDVGTDRDRAPQIHDVKPLCSCQGLDDKLNRGDGRKRDTRGRERRGQRQNKGGCPLTLFLPVYINAEEGC